MARLPAVGDWVLADWTSKRHARIERIFSARTRFSRKGAGNRVWEQVLAANVDLVFLVTSLSGDFNLRRLERYLTVAWESGVRPVVVLNKSDLSTEIEEVEDRRASAGSAAIGVPVLVTSAVNGDGIEALRACLRVGETSAFLGSSGVGKSALINAMLRRESQRVGPVRARDGRGQHTTTAAELLFRPGGPMLIDTPGLRELQLWDAGDGIDAVFEDVLSLAARCRFRDCRHAAEPGCAVQQAREAGSLDPGRLESYRKLESEREFSESRRDPVARAARLRKFKQITREQRRLYKDAGERR
jgi:ribosome biogenesis GTPase